MCGDKPREACGVFAVCAPGADVARLTYYGLYALQHRGQESAGIAVADGQRILLHKEMGLVAEVFSEERLAELKGYLAIGHVRYSTTGASHPVNAQPLVFYCGRGMLGLAHNGNLSNGCSLRRELLASGAVFQSTTDSEVLINLIARLNGDHNLPAAIRRCMAKVEGAYSLVILTEDRIYAVRDPYGFRPLCVGQIDSGWAVASESCALDAVGARFLRDLTPGEILEISPEGLSSYGVMDAPRRAHCVFEYIYFARPDSTLDGFNVGRVRREMGRQLAREFCPPADIVVPVPDSGIAAARGYAEVSGLCFEEGLMKNRYAGRTFIQPSQRLRDTGVRLKLNPVREVVAGKRVVLVDDSIVRGTTSRRIVKMLREAGAREIFYCLSSPPIIRSCYYGIDTSNETELIAAQLSVEEIRRHIGADGLHYLSIEGLLGVFGARAQDMCVACFTGDYPVKVKDAGAGKFAFESLVLEVVG
ncbi:amidophosphoribosyltransferase [Thermodesulfitimonas autotrophica]|uniref:Amidophosphoribosyltransferase n=1 Tax=Thermodesulfitimonas autotrophica TaxID=1894989 RepID=A0A3N5BG89_9THEO|nr:amidophosphoribosyltransferase [Thermodesulfitimonas autotrophica]RPF47082.1 amidophosphoribosyltransferase [Thermodesulfitimonas autotrophica]